ncbi:hypothetical protein BC938DRAFT_483995 [Jimgerdemannia flammicorona]|uniref:Uncharacterized protein n=1 Tax=Jimgerdemannia flammicorona TaxID=994334 RepID=A0A433QAS0_9FUNG|nr:hypothetical protein BC938DRAFT_483995 [Jimgerdemannia flammicorona]
MSSRVGEDVGGAGEGGEREGDVGGRESVTSWCGGDTFCLVRYVEDVYVRDRLGGAIGIRCASDLIDEIASWKETNIWLRFRVACAMYIMANKHVTISEEEWHLRTDGESCVTDGSDRQCRKGGAGDRL